MPPFPPNRNNGDKGRPEIPPGQGGGSQSRPMGPPPGRIPEQPVNARSGARAVSPGSIRGCIGRFTYVWLRNGQEFWLFPIQIWGNSVAGFRWERRFGWVYTGISLNRIDMFTCSV